MYRKPDLSNNIFDCLLTAMTKVQSIDRKASFLFVGDLNAHHEEWLGSSMATVLDRAVLDFASPSVCEQVVTLPKKLMEGFLIWC